MGMTMTIIYIWDFIHNALKKIKSKIKIRYLYFESRWTPLCNDIIKNSSFKANVRILIFTVIFTNYIQFKTSYILHSQLGPSHVLRRIRQGIPNVTSIVCKCMIIV